MVMTAPPSLPCAAFLIAALLPPLFVHVAWLKSSLSRPFAVPLDGGRYYRGRRVFGDNKMWRGLMVLPVASMISFAVFSAFREKLPEWITNGMWNLPDHRYALLGFAAGLAIMLAELPNSFLKRQMGVAPGQAPSKTSARVFCFLLDRFDSAVGALLVVQCLVPLVPATWFWALLLGGLTHVTFSYLLFRLRVKARAL